MADNANIHNVCTICGSVAHTNIECPSERKARKSFCYTCGKLGHRSDDCKSGGGPELQNDNSSDSLSTVKSSTPSTTSEFNSSRIQDTKSTWLPSSSNSQSSDKKQKYGKKKDLFRSRKPPTHEALEPLYKTNMVSRNPVGANFERYGSISVYSSDPAFNRKRADSFEELGLHSDILKIVKRLGFEKPTPIQATAMNIIDCGRNLIASAQTGVGKTAAFLLPLLNNLLRRDARIAMGLPQHPKALIIAPTRELAQQICDEATKFSALLDLKIGLCHGRTSFTSELNRISAGSHILIGTLGRITDHIERGNVSVKDLRYLIFDEADRILEEDFSDNISCFLEYIQNSQCNPQYLLFSATNARDIIVKMKHVLQDYVVLRVGIVGTVNEDIDQRVIEVREESKPQKLLELIQAELALPHAGTKILVFVNSKQRAEQVSEELLRMKVPSQMMQSDMDQTERNLALKDFEQGNRPVLVATLVASRGLDMTLVSHVINYDLPFEIDDYVNCVGRTGRAGNTGRATSFFDPANRSDVNLAPELRAKLEEAGMPDIPDFLEQKKPFSS